MRVCIANFGEGNYERPVRKECGAIAQQDSSQSFAPDAHNEARPPEAARSSARPTVATTD